MLKTIFYISILLTILTFSTVYADKNTTLKSSKEDKIERMDIERFYKNRDSSHRYEFTLSDGTKVVQTGEKEEDFHETRTNPKNPLFQENRAYYATGELWGKWIEYKNRFNYGTSYTYDKQGNIIKQTNYEEGYIYNWKDIKKYCGAHHIDLFEKLTAIRKRSREGMISSYKPENISFKNHENTLKEKDAFIAYEAKKGKVNKVWRIIYESSSGTLRTIHIDARQGNVMYIVDAPLSNGRPAYYRKNIGAVLIDKSKVVYKYKN